ncbi:IS1 family transposase [Hymenobacter nivis]|uniref:IS1 family transposase n=1 Tax=Hymenobacter nivis TaxID=1850093 RepID=A0A2Z3GII7_9BACT|nr:IS1 family transposase [Hymenobacter nivis]AWM32001.1 IS1 family transposase [Hymenobacter nivis]
MPRLRPKKAQRKEWEILELDELWSFVGHKKRKVWLWLAVERARRRIVGWALGSRGEAPLRKLWQALPRRYHRHCWYFTDQWKAYAKVLPRWQHRPCPKGEGQTNSVEAINCSLRQRCGVLVRYSTLLKIGHKNGKARPLEFLNYQMRSFP